MTPARSLAAGVAALGFASTLSVSLPAHATTPIAAPAQGAPAPCERAERYAAQAEAEFLRIERLDLRGGEKREHGAGVTKRDSGERPSVVATDPAGGAAGNSTPTMPSAETDESDIDVGGSGSAPAVGGIAAGADSEKNSGKSDGYGGTGSTSDADPAGDGRAAGGRASGQEIPGSSSHGSKPPSDGSTSSTGGSKSPSGGATAPESGSKPKGLLGGIGDLLGGIVPAAYRVGGPVTVLRAGDDDRTELGRPGATDNAAGSDDNATGGGGSASKKGGTTSGDDGAQGISGVGVGDARSVMIADAPIKSAAAGMLLDGRVAGAPAAEQVLQQAPPSHTEPIEQHTGSKRFGPIQVGAGAMSAHARWNPAMGCAAVDGEISRSATRLDRMTLHGDLIRVPEKLSSLSSTAVNGHGNGALAVASATVSAGRIELAGGKVQVRVLRAPTLRVSMSATTGGQVRYQPALVEVSGPGISRTRLSTGSDHVDVTVGSVGRVTEAATVQVLPSSGSPLPSIPGLPAPSGGSGGGSPVLESVPADGQAVVRVSLGEVRQASKGHALAARATAIKVSVVAPSEQGRGQAGYASSAMVADLGIGVLEAAAVAPEQGKHAVESGVQSGTLPVTGPRLAPMFVTGASLLVGGALALLLSARRRRRAA
ncbi:hypothetical protein [Actinoplanes sp. HUAS TT8]|uniref:hypothetical protein n=1 Tax=Actinoplanes sp. HUAS TT8 TaxID=3447453 RepID=UPI003F51E360